MEYLFELRVEGGESIAIVGLSIRMTPVGCSEASLCEDAKRMQRSVVMPGEERKMQSGPHRPPARMKSGGGHAVGGGEQRQETVWRNYSRVCSQRAVAHLARGAGDGRISGFFERALFEKLWTCASIDSMHIFSIQRSLPSHLLLGWKKPRNMPPGAKKPASGGKKPALDRSQTLRTAGSSKGVRF